MVVLWIVGLGLFGALLAYPLPPRSLLDPVGGLAVFTFAILMAVGWAAGLVPYVALRDETPTAEGGYDRLPTMRVWVTGKIGREPWLKRYRNRAGTLRQSGPQTLSVGVRHWAIWLAEHGFARESAKPGLRRPAACVLLEPGSIQAMSRGTAYLSTRTRPAIKLSMAPGALILAFEDEAARDGVAGALSALMRGEALPKTRDASESATRGASTSKRADVWNDRAWLRRTTDNLGWIEPTFLAVCVGSAWRLVALVGLGQDDTLATVVAVALAWLALMAREAARPALGLAQRRVGSALIAGVVATVVLFIPLGYHIGHGVLAAAVLFALSGAALIEAYVMGCGRQRQ